MARRIATIANVVVVLLLSAGPVVPQSPSPDVIAAARDLVTASRANEQLRTLLPLLVQQIKPLIVQGRPEVERDFDAIMPAMMSAMNARLSEFSDAVATIYARNFTADELRQIRAFYGTPAGQKLLDKMPTIAQESLALGQKLGQTIANERKGRFTDELRKRGHNI